MLGKVALILRLPGFDEKEKSQEIDEYFCIQKCAPGRWEHPGFCCACGVLGTRQT
jgi:hypothetical protein